MPKRASILLKMKMPKSDIQELVSATMAKLGEETNLRDLMDRIEMEFLTVALTKTHGNRTLAGQMLGLNRTTVIEKLRRFGWLKRTWA